MSSGTEYTITFVCDSDDVDAFIAKVEGFAKQKHHFGFDQSSMSGAYRQMTRMESTAKRTADIFKDIGRGFDGLSRAASTIGGALGGNVINTAKSVVTAFATMGLSSAAQGTIERYDIMKLFPKRMSRLGFSETQAKQSIDKLEQSVIGLPTGLDAIVSSANQLISLTGDLKRGTDLAIATNNAFLAGGADAQQVEYGQRQIRDLIAAGTLRTQEWDSLFKSLGAGLGLIAEEMGYTGKSSSGIKKNNDELKKLQQQLKKTKSDLFVWETEGGHKQNAIDKKRMQIANLEAAIASMSEHSEKDLGDFRQALKSGEISAEEFTNALIKAAGMDDEGNLGPLAMWTEDIKDTLGAAKENIGNAIKKLGAAGIEALDNLLTAKTGTGLVGNIKAVSDSIKQDLVPALQGWVVEHGDQIVAFFDRLKNYDWKALISKVGDGLAKYYDIFSKFFTLFSPGFIANVAVWSGPASKIFEGLGGIFRFLGGIIGAISLRGASKKLKEAGEFAGGLTKFAFNFKNAFKGLALGAGFVGIIGELGLVIAEFVKIGEMIGKANFGNFDQNIGKVGTFIAEVGGIVATMVTIFGLISKSKTAATAIGLGELISGGFIALIAAVGGVIAEYVNIIDQVSKLDIPSDAKITELGDVVESLNKNLLKKVKKVPNKDVAALSNLSEATSYAVDIATELKRLKEVGNVGDMSKKIGNVIKAANEILKANYDKSDQKKSGIINKTLGNVKEATDSIKNIATTLSESKDTIKALTDKQGMTDMKINIGIMMESLVGDATTGNGGVLNRFQQKTAEYENMEKNMGSFSAAIKSLSEMMQTLVDAKSNMSALVKQGHGKLMYTDVGKQIDTLITSVSKPFKKNKLFANTKEYSVVSSNMEKFSKIASSVSTIAKSLVDSMANLDALTRKTPHGGLYVMEDSDMIKKIGAVIRNVKSVADTFKHSDIDTSGEAKDKATALSDVVGALPALFENLQGLVEPISSLGVSGEDWQLADDLKTIITGIQGAFAELSSSDYADLVTNAESLKGATDQLSGIIDGLQAVQDKISGLGIADGAWQAGLDLGTAINTITGIFPQNFGQTMAGGDALGGAAANLNAIAGALEKIAANAGSASGNLDKAKSSLDAFGKAAATHKKDIGQVAAQTARLKSALDGIFGKGMTAAMGVNAVGNAAGAQAWNLRSAASAAASLASAISSIPTNKTVNVTTHYATTNASGTAAASSGTHSVGGHITRASGGPVWGRGGIDNIPAMLSNGEFVMRSRAHSTFGTAFMNRINNLDVEGAMRALSLRAGSGILSRAKVTNNYTRDNHANVTFNVNRATQGYAQRRASRWARALS